MTRTKNTTRRSPPRELWGAAAGAGFGITEAIVIVGINPGAIGIIAIVERFSSTLFHIGASSIAVGNGLVRSIYFGITARYGFTCAHDMPDKLNRGGIDEKVINYSNRPNAVRACPVG